MKVLFIAREKRDENLSSIILAQADSLINQGVELHYFHINRSGVYGYFLESLRLRR